MLLPDWKRVLRHAWSVRLLVAAGGLSGLEVALPYLDQWLSIPRGLFAALSGLTVGGAFVARLLVQQKVSGNAD